MPSGRASGRPLLPLASFKLSSSSAPRKQRPPAWVWCHHAVSVSRRGLAHPPHPETGCPNSGNLPQVLPPLPGLPSGRESLVHLHVSITVSIKKKKINTHTHINWGQGVDFSTNAYGHQGINKEKRKLIRTLSGYKNFP